MQPRSFLLLLDLMTKYHMLCNAERRDGRDRSSRERKKVSRERNYLSRCVGYSEAFLSQRTQNLPFVLWIVIKVLELTLFSARRSGFAVVTQWLHTHK